MQSLGSSLASYYILKKYLIKILIIGSQVGDTLLQNLERRGSKYSKKMVHTACSLDICLYQARKILPFWLPGQR
jgi:hypothetical protein